MNARMAGVARAAGVALLALAAGCASRGRTSAAPEPSPFDVLAIAEVPAGHVAAGMAFGGISGIDRDRSGGTWYLLSDDRGEHGPPRFHVARIDTAADSTLRVEVLSTTVIRPPGSNPGPRSGSGVPGLDGESIRIDPEDGTLWLASEGDAAVGAGAAIWNMDGDGRLLGAWPLPAMLASDPDGRRGPRPNRSFEGLAWDETGSRLWLAMEAPLIEDGPPPDQRRGALVRLSLLGREGALHAQRAYRVDPVPPHPPGRLADNGISEILSAGDGRLLVLERAGVQRADGGFEFRSRLYCTAVDSAPDVADAGPFEGREVRPVAKRLLLDLGRLPGVPRANFEAMGWGPVLDDGRATLLLASDNNFDAGDASVFVLLASDRAIDASWLARHCPGADAS